MILIFLCLGLIACENEIDNSPKVAVSNTDIATAETDNIPEKKHVVIENKSYLFDVTEHSLSELEALLARAEEVTQSNSSEHDDLEIVMIIHGPDIEWFTQQNYAHNQKLIDLAARLDAYDIIDMKVCEKTMSHHGVEREDIPEFIDTVPYAPIEIENRLSDGYINL